MADVVSVHSANSLVYTGKGQVTGIVITASTGNPLATIYNNTSAAGTKIFEAYVTYLNPLVLFLDDRYALRFVIGCYLELAANLTVTLWTRQV